MHILYINARYPPEGVGGPTHSTRFIAEEMVRQGHRTTVFCRSFAPGLAREEAAGVTVIRAGLDMPWPQVLQALVRILDESAPDVVHAMFPREILLNPLTDEAHARAIPIVQTLLSFNFLCEQEFMRDGRACTAQCGTCMDATQRQRLYCGRVDAAVAISRYMLELHERAGLFADTQLRRVIPEAYAPENPTTLSHGADDKTLNLGFLGRLNPLKGLDLLLAELTGPTLSYRAWNLRIAGTGDPGYIAELKRRYQDPRIRFLGYVEPAAFLSDIDALIAPALWEEPLGRVVIEAYAHAVPALASRRGGMAELIEHERTGLLFEPEQPGSLAQAILRCLDSPEWLREAKPRALAKWREEFTPETVARSYLEVYSEVIRRRESTQSTSDAH